MKSDIPIVLLASGSSSRMRGADKLLEQINGTTLIRNRVLECMKATSGPIYVTLPPQSAERFNAVSDLRIIPVITKGSHLGISHSIKVSLSQIDNSEVIILLADLVEITNKDLTKIIVASKTSKCSIIRGIDDDGKVGHPVLIRKVIIDEFRKLSKDQGGNSILKKNSANTNFVTLPNKNATLDLDSPEDWASWRAKKAKSS